MANVDGVAARGDEPDGDLAGAARLIAHALDAWYTALGRQYGPLSRPQRRMLHAMEQGGGDGPRMSDLAQRLGLTAAGATRMVDMLQGRGYVRRFRAPGEDQRQVYVAATPAGTAALAEADRAFEERVRRSLESLTPEERAWLGDLLRRVGEREAEGT
jgi:DNA-binding MarR family transcriptional regulator